MTRMRSGPVRPQQMFRRVLLMLGLAGTGAVVPSSARAQVTPPPGGEMRGARADYPRRADLEKQFQQRVDALVRQRLQLSDEQATKLREVASRAEEARRGLRREEMMARKAMREELLAGDNANEARVADMLEQLPRLERRRIDLLEQEQRELARFLSPVQRARYFALQDELRRGMQEVQRRRMGMTDSTHGEPGGQGERPTRRRPPGGNR